VAVAVLAGALSTADWMTMFVAGSAGALVSGSIEASFSASAGFASDAGAIAAGSEVGVASIDPESSSLLFSAWASEVAGDTAIVSATDAAIVDSDGPAAASWLASDVAGASTAIAAAQATDDNPRIAGEASSKFKKVLFIFLTPSHSTRLEQQVPTAIFCSCLPVHNNFYSLRANSVKLFNLIFKLAALREGIFPDWFSPIAGEPRI